MMRLSSREWREGRRVVSVSRAEACDSSQRTPALTAFLTASALAASTTTGPVRIGFVGVVIGVVQRSVQQEHRHEAL